MSNSNYGTSLERFIFGGLFIICGFYVLPQSYQGAFFLIGVGIVFLMSINRERRNEFIDFFWEKFKRLVDAILKSE
jgi:hypothetical protein